MSSKPFNVAVDLIDLYWDDPPAFAEDMLDFHPDPWQRAVMMDLAQNSHVSVRSGQGVGKTGLEAAITLWYLSCRPYPKVVCTAPTKQQLHDVLWAEIAKWLNTSKMNNFLKWTATKIYMVGQKERWFATARTATRPENMQGFHEDYMLFLVDEASGVADPILEAILGTLSGLENKLLMCGNPTRTSGIFYDSHNRDRADYKTHKVSCLDSPRTSKENIAKLKRKYGEGSDVYRVRVEGEFPRGESDSFIALESAEHAKSVRCQPSGTKLYVGVDVARFGDDETCIYGRIGGKVLKFHHHHKQDTMVTTGWVIRLINELRAEHPVISEVEIRIDDSGVGGAVTDRLNEINSEKQLGYTIIPVNNGSSSDDESYANKGAETWGTVKDLLEQNMTNFVLGLPGVLEVPDDEKLIAQLTTRKWRMNSSGKILLERKEEMKKRGLPSPDRADAFVLAFADIQVKSGFAFG
ncbi:terminase B [Paenibacillus chitinolyticus]|uniref:Phage terminase large subunit n=1 Tax=Paenibacillus chitinolyticus TaxID=79263 RepID=A0A410X0C8_9BACL|nr:phage terminase large subunit [Paenibacillus chitinolyticus]MCY9593732.1 phage terminase large subunit [Paenibacillus chitinolyticus]MCY9599702.1 phage terminase large subunit [Paenibacillus chitinolyticus]QAV20124.1 terminase B [Paenibacillus chitinolyticus]